MFLIFIYIWVYFGTLLCAILRGSILFYIIYFWQPALLTTLAGAYVKVMI